MKTDSKNAFNTRIKMASLGDLNARCDATQNVARGSRRKKNTFRVTVIKCK